MSFFSLRGVDHEGPASVDVFASELTWAFSWKVQICEGLTSAVEIVLKNEQVH